MYACMFKMRSSAAVRARNPKVGCLCLFSRVVTCEAFWIRCRSFFAEVLSHRHKLDTHWCLPQPGNGQIVPTTTDILTWTVCASKPCISSPGGRTCTPWGCGPNALSAAEIDTG